MSLINGALAVCMLGGLATLFLNWELVDFYILLLGVTAFLIVSAIKIPRMRGVALPASSVALVLTIAELVIPILPLGKHMLAYIDPESDYGNGSYLERIPGFGYRPNPGTHTSRKLTSTGEVIYDVIYTIGSDGYRADLDVERFDAYIYGGSFTFGEGLNDDETLSYFLNNNHQISAKNVGVHGYGLNQALYNIEHGVTSSEPNSVNVLLTAPWHSLRSACKQSSFTVGTPRYRFGNGALTLDGVCPGDGGDGGDGFAHRFLTKSNAYNLFGRALANNKNTITDSDMELYLEIIREISRLSNENDASLVIAYIDATDKQLSTTSWTNESLLSELRTISDVVVDVTLSETAEELDARFYIHELDDHPSALANEFRAQKIADVIKSFLVPKPQHKRGIGTKTTRQ